MTIRLRHREPLVDTWLTGFSASSLHRWGSSALPLLVVNGNLRPGGGKTAPDGASGSGASAGGSGGEPNLNG
jgi:hypothetical protein